MRFPECPPAVPVVAARFTDVLKVIPAEHAPCLDLQCLLDDQPRGEVDQLAAGIGRRGHGLDQVGRFMAVRMEPGILLPRMGCVIPLGPANR